MEFILVLSKAFFRVGNISLTFFMYKSFRTWRSPSTELEAQCTNIAITPVTILHKLTNLAYPKGWVSPAQSDDSMHNYSVTLSWDKFDFMLYSATVCDQIYFMNSQLFGLGCCRIFVNLLAFMSFLQDTTWSRLKTSYTQIFSFHSSIT